MQKYKDIQPSCGDKWNGFGQILSDGHSIFYNPYGLLQELKFIQNEGMPAGMGKQIDKITGGRAMRRIVTIVLILIAFFISGCSTAITPVMNIAEITEVDLQKVPKRGEDCMTFYLPFILSIGPFGSASVIKAANKAGISKVKLVDHEYHYNFFTLRSCVVVYGE